MAPPTIPLAERFWPKVKIAGPDECWIWQACRFPDGYGQIRINHQNILAHRVSYELTHGPIPDGLLVLHRCDVKPCVNPAHLFLGTHQDNDRDAMSKGLKPFGWRNQSGERNHQAKLTAEQVIEIRRLRREEGTTFAVLARDFGVGGSTITSILTRRKWAHLP